MNHKLYFQEGDDQEQQREVQDWMLLCQNAAFPEADLPTGESLVDWSLAGKIYAERYGIDLHEMASFIPRHQQEFKPSPTAVTADPDKLQGKQLEAYRSVCESIESGTPLRMIVSGTAGTGKSYLIKCLQQLLGDRLRVAAPTGGAAYNVLGQTLHSLLGIPVKGDFKDLEGQRLRTMQEALAGVDYFIIDEMSMVGRKLFGKVDRRLRQAFPHR